MANVPANGNLVGVGENLAGLEMILGRLPDVIRHDHIYQQSRAYSDLTELLLTRAPRVVSEQIRGLLVDGYRSVLLNEILPIRMMQPGDSGRIEWSTIHFDPALAPQVEVEGVAPIYTHNKTKHSARVVRRATGIKMESGFYQTPEGRREWAQKIAHLAAIVQNTNEIEAMFVLLENPLRQRVHADELNGPYNIYGLYGAAPSYLERLRMDVAYFGIVNKTPSSRGFQNLVTSVRTAMGRNGVRPDYFLVPPMMMGFYYGDKDDLWHYSSAGPQALKNRADATDINDNGPIRAQQVQGLKVVDLNLYRMTNSPASTDAVDIMTVPRQIGEFYAAEAQSTYRIVDDFKDFYGTDRDIRIFNEEHGVMATVRFVDMIRNCFRWDDTGAVDANRHDELTQQQKDLRRDPFFCNDVVPAGAPLTNGWKTVKKWGHVMPNHLTTKTLESVAYSLRKCIGDALPSFRLAVEGIIQAGRNFQQISNLGPGGPIPVTATNVVDDNGIVFTTADAANYITNVKSYVQTKCAQVKKIWDLIFGTDPKLVTPVYTDDEVVQIFVDLMGANLDQISDAFFNPVATAASKEVAKSLTKIDKVDAALLLAWLQTHVHRDTLVRQHEKNIYVPINFLLARPYMTYNVSSAIIVKGGADTGETVIGGVDFQCTSNNMDRTIYGSLVYYGKSIVRDDRNVAVTPSVFIQSYIKGNDTTFMTEADLAQIAQDGGLRDSRNSIMCMAVSGTETPSRHTVLDIRGRHDRLGNSADSGNADAPFYGTYMYYENALQIEGTMLEDPAAPFVDYRGREYNCNSICWRGHYEFGRGFKHVNSNTGHLGMNVYDGVHLSRTPGNYVPVRQVAYANHTLI